MERNKITIIGGGVLGTQIGLMCAYVGKDVTFWLRSPGSVERTMPKIQRYAELMRADLLKAKTLIGSPMGKFVYPRGLIRDWDSVTAEEIDALAAQAEARFADSIHVELDLAAALADADLVIEAMAEEPQAKIAMYTAMKDLMPEKTVLLTNSSTLLPSTFAPYTGRPEKFLALHFANTIWKPTGTVTRFFLVMTSSILTLKSSMNLRSRFVMMPTRTPLSLQIGTPEILYFPMRASAS